MPEDRPSCECSDEYGPCEQHGTVLVSREGAALRNPDEQVMQLIEDLLDVGAELSVAGREEYERLSENFHAGTFTSDDFGGADWLATQLESTVDHWVIYDDGYVIVSANHDCPLLEG
jgi:hypothetical protein